ncbi:MAG: hypothetical protein HY774_07915 [Acidobacteria bacterium]|nr:hypothetical protein [Acidobacteriota bacterium]
MTQPLDLKYRVREIATPAVPVDPSVTPVELLDPVRTEQLLNRLPPATPIASAETAVFLPEKSLPLPVAGVVVEAQFQPGEGPELPDARPEKPLEIRRVSPVGEVEYCQSLAVHFSEPMVALAGFHEMLTSQQTLVHLEPQPPGRWRWAGTHTLMFEPEAERFPMATLFRVTIPAGIQSSSGNTLAKSKERTFQTLPPRLQASFPTRGTYPLQPLLFLEFDQQIDPLKVLPSLSLEVGTQRFPVKLASPDQIGETNQPLSKLVKYAKAGRWILFQPVNPLPNDADVTVRLKSGTPSAEGPLVTTTDVTFSFHTLGPLRLVSYPCMDRKECLPDNWLFFTFSNELNKETFVPEMVTVCPEVSDLKLSVSNTNLILMGKFAEDTTYTVQFSGELSDTSGQKLGEPREVILKFGHFGPFLSTDRREMVILDPAGERVFELSSYRIPKLRVQLFRVLPEDWSQFVSYRSTHFEQKKNAKSLLPPGLLVSDQTIEIPESNMGRVTTTRIDLSPALTDRLGHVVVMVDPIGIQRTSRNDTEILWIQSTSLAADIVADQEGLLVWANALTDGKPIADAEVTLLPTQLSGQTDHQGLVLFSESNKTVQSTSFLVVRKEADSVLLPESKFWWRRNSGSFTEKLAGQLRWFVFDDRRLYQPGEVLKFKGWIRQLETKKGGDLISGKWFRELVAYQVTDAAGRSLVKGALRLNVFGGFDGSIVIPTNAELGQASIHFTLKGSITAKLDNLTYRHPFDIQQFRRPEYELKVTTSDGPHVIGTSALATVFAGYFAGGPLKKAETQWNCMVSDGKYEPPNWDGFSFGHQGHNRWRFPGIRIGQSCTGTTDAEGHHCIQFDFDEVTQPAPVVVNVEASVTDVNRQVQTAKTTILVHPSELYVGLNPRQRFVFPGETLEIDLIATNVEGTPQAGKTIQLDLVRIEWQRQKRSFEMVEVDPQSETIVSEASPVTWKSTPTTGGLYQLTATVSDDQNRPNQTVISLWVAGVSPRRSLQFHEEHFELISNRKTFAPGETAEILLQAPFFPTEGLLTVQRSGVIHYERFTLDRPARTFLIPITDHHIPNITVQVNLIGETFRRDENANELTDAPKQPAYASSMLELSVSAKLRRLTVTATPKEEKVYPASKTSITLAVTDVSGTPVQNTECVVVVVDEAILALSMRPDVDPSEWFYQKRKAGTVFDHTRDNLVLAPLSGNLEMADHPNQLFRRQGGAAAGAAYGAAPLREEAVYASMPIELNPATLSESRFGLLQQLLSASPGGDQDPIRLRTNFSPLAAFVPSVVTDEQGRATVDIELPDNLTRYRILVFAVAGDNLFGKGESALTARLPLMVRPSPPRFLNFGDAFELPIVIQNQNDELLAVDVAVRSSHLSFPNGAGRHLVVPAGDRRELRIPASPTQPGPAILDVAACAGAESDAAQSKLPIYEPATTEATATYGEVADDPIQIPVSVPTDVLQNFGKLEVTTTSTQLQALTDAVLYLAEYQFDCSEQIASRIMGLTALKDVLSQFPESSKLPSNWKLSGFLEADLKVLSSRQHSSGGFSFWKNKEKADPFLSVHVAHALVRAKNKGVIETSNLQYSSVIGYLRKIEQGFPAKYPEDAKLAVKAYALYVRHLNHDTNPTSANLLVQNRDLTTLRLEVIGWVLPVLAASEKTRGECEHLIQHLSNRVVETGHAASFIESHTDDERLLLHSNRRTDAVLLEALLLVKPDSDLIPKLVQGLLAHRRKGRWLNTQENVFVLLALERYFTTYETTPPDFLARIWLGDDFAGEQVFEGRTTVQHQLSISMKHLGTADESKPVTLSKTGAGRMYYRLGLTYAPTTVMPVPVEAGFSVSREYHAVDDPDDVKRSGSNEWQIRAGARVKITVTLVVPSRRYHVALVDPLPAGLEILNPELKTTRSVQLIKEEDLVKGRVWDWTWFEHQNLRDHCAEAFASRMWEGVHTYRYFAIATTPGRFIALPPKAEEMYAPETFGCGRADVVVVTE